MNGKGFVYNGASMDTYIVEYPKKEYCMSHETYENIVSLDTSAKTTRIKDFLDFIREDFSRNAVLEFEREIVHALVCKECSTQDKIFKALGKVTEKEGRCPACGAPGLPSARDSAQGCRCPAL
jgi:adenylyltransferase/sulfurtransferase